MKKAPGSSVEPVFSSSAGTQASGVSSCCSSRARNQRAAVGRAKAYALSPGLGKGEAMEGRRTKLLCDDGGPGQYLIQQCSPFSVCAKGHPAAAHETPPSCQHTNRGRDPDLYLGLPRLGLFPRHCPSANLHAPRGEGPFPKFIFGCMHPSVNGASGSSTA